MVVRDERVEACDEEVVRNGGGSIVGPDTAGVLEIVGDLFGGRRLLVSDLGGLLLGETGLGKLGLEVGALLLGLLLLLLHLGQVEAVCAGLSVGGSSTIGIVIGGFRLLAAALLLLCQALEKLCDFFDFWVLSG